MTWLICQPHNPIHISGLFRPEFQNQLVKKILRIGVPNGMENGMKPEETVQKYVTLEEYSDSYK